MSTLSDVREVYAGLHDVWASARAHLLAHVVATFLIFGVARVTLPELHGPIVDAQTIIKSDWFVLAKESGVIYITLVVPFVLIAVYGTVLRVFGHALLAFIVIFLEPRLQITRTSTIDEWTLEPLGLARGSEDFTLADLFADAMAAVNRSQIAYTKKDVPGWKMVTTIAENARAYFGDFVIFLVGWIVIFVTSRDTSWQEHNVHAYWPVISMLFILSAASAFRVWRTLNGVPNMVALFATTELRKDSEVAGQSISEERRTRVRARIRELLDEEDNEQKRRPSLLGYLRHKLGLSKRRVTAEQNSEAPTIPQSGWPLRQVYANGRQFDRDVEVNAAYAGGWLRQYASWLYYRLHKSFTFAGSTAWMMIRLFFLGSV